MLALFKYTLLFSSFLCLTACWPFENNDKEPSNTSLLPEINTNLSSESPVGIWMLDIDATSEVTLYDENNTDITSVEKSDHQIREFITISQLLTGDYIIQECSLTRAPNVMIANGFLSSLGFTLKSNTLSFLLEISSEDIETLQHIISAPFSSQADLILDRNLSLKGSASQRFKSRPINTNDPLVPAYKSYDQTNILDIKGVKISDETNFFQANELTTNFTINGVPFLDTEETAMECLRIENKKTTVTLQASDTLQEVSYSAEKFISANFNYGNRVFLQLDELSTIEKTRLLVFTDNSLFSNPELPIHYPFCEGTSDDCQEITTVTSSLNENTPNTIGGTITASPTNGGSIEIEISVTLN